jgi:O-antigen ligase
MSLERESRLNVYKVLEGAISENYWLGNGYGSFEKSFRLYRDKTVTGYFTAAHNSYLENMFELGVLQALSLFGAIFFIMVKCLRGVWSRQTNWAYPAIGFSASILVGIHALVDFSLQIPAIAYAYALLMGAAFAQSLPRAQRLSSRR